MKKTFVLLSVLEKRAKELKEEKSLKLHQARDESAKEFGFSNFKNYKNTSEAAIIQYKSLLEGFYKYLPSIDDDNKKIGFAILFIQDNKIPSRDLFDILKTFQNIEAAVHVICDNLHLLKDEIQSFLLNSFLTEEGQYEINFRSPHFTAKEILTNRLTYEMNGDKLRIDGDYLLKTEFEYELDKNDPMSRDDRFKDREYAGSFGIEVDRNMRITDFHSDMSIDDESTPMHKFNKEGIDNYYNQFPDERGRFDNVLVLYDGDYGVIKKCLSDGEPLTGKHLNLALELVDVQGDDEHSNLIKNIGVKLKVGKPLGDYEHHILVDVLMLHAQLGS